MGYSLEEDDFKSADVQELPENKGIDIETILGDWSEYWQQAYKKCRDLGMNQDFSWD